MKLITVHYLGFTAMDRRFSVPMLPWIISEIRKRDSCEQVSLGVEDGVLQSYNLDFELQWSHRLNQVTRFSTLDGELGYSFLYLYRDDEQRLLYCYLFQAAKQSDVQDLYQQMREGVQTNNQGPPQRSLSSAAQLTALCPDISPSSSHFFEVLYVGKIKISHRKVPESFIDDALEKFRAHDAERPRSRRNTDASEISDERRSSIDSTASCDTISASETPSQESPPEDASPEHNRTMVLQVGRIDLRLISPDRKQVLLHKQHRDIASCVHGISNPEHFGFICKEYTPPATVSSSTQQVQSYVGYVFKCESPSVVSDAVSAVSQAFTSHHQQQNSTENLNKPPAGITSCDHCPMVWYHRLCTEIENLSDRKTQAAIVRRLDQLDEDEQQIILAKWRGAEPDGIRDQNEFLMMLLRAHCEAKQQRHVHDTAENRSEFLSQYLGVSAGHSAGHAGIFTKAKRSLSSSFDHLLKRKGSRDDVNLTATTPGSRTSDMTLPITQHVPKGARRRFFSECSSETDPDAGELTPVSRTRASSCSQPTETQTTPSPRSPMMDMFMKVGSGGSPSRGDGRPTTSSWRHAIFERVSHSPASTNRIESTPRKTPRSKSELRELWKRAIKQAILLIRMEKENARIRARQEETAVKRIKLEYDELSQHTVEQHELWEQIAQVSSRVELPPIKAVSRGIPRARRGDAWRRMAEKHEHGRVPPHAPQYDVSYERLLRQLTSHQHAILIDLGRTFPNHPYFSSPLGPGQLALFNLLKAYSLLDPEVGYCQGLSFVAGVLLLHMEESEAYGLLKHLMWRRELREQYLPDMRALQIQLYQLSRLLHDRLPDLYEHLDTHEVAPTLYAAPWMLTLFASQFPLGFVARVLDLLFLEGRDVLFRIALSLLSHHHKELLERDTFEDIMDYIKNVLPKVDPVTTDKIMYDAFHPGDGISKRLDEYRTEYQVLQEEMASVKPIMEQVDRLQNENASLHDHNKQLAAQLELAQANVQRLERNRALQQSQLNRLEMQNRGLEVSVATLGAFIDSLVEDKIDVEIPGEVRRIVGQLSVAAERRRIQQPPQKMVKSLSTGKIGVNTTIPEMPRSNSLSSHETKLPGLRVIADSTSDEIPRSKPSSLGTKVSHFFSASHGHILGHPSVKQIIREDSREGAPVSPTSLQPSVVVTPDVVTPTESPTDSIDSGVGTPLSPKHPLSNCDVNFTFNGTTRLKNIRDVRNISRNSSPDLLGK